MNNSKTLVIKHSDCVPNSYFDYQNSFYLSFDDEPVKVIEKLINRGWFIDENDNNDCVSIPGFDQLVADAKEAEAKISNALKSIDEGFLFVSYCIKNNDDHDFDLCDPKAAQRSGPVLFNVPSLYHIEGNTAYWWFADRSVWLSCGANSANKIEALSTLITVKGA